MSGEDSKPNQPISLEVCFKEMVIRLKRLKNSGNGMTLQRKKE